MTTALHVSTQGQGDDVVLLHGLFGMGSNLGALARSLRDRYRVHSPDLPDHGRSAWTQGSTLVTMADAIGAWMQAQGIERAHVAGHSLGGKVAMQLALAAPARVRSLLVADIAPVGYAPSHDGVFTALAAVDEAECTSRAAAAEVMRPLLEEDEVLQFLLLSLQRNEHGLYRWRFNLAGLRQNYAAYRAAPVGNTAYPGRVLFVRGDESAYIKPEHEVAIRQFFPQAAISVMQGCGHWLHAQDPATFNAISGAFFDAGAA